MNPLIWPALKGWKPSTGTLLTRRAIYGKVHRAPTDYRWFAWSGGFGASGPSPLQRDLAFGIEDQAASFCGWRYSGAGAVALRCYPSRASDSAGRPAVVEKQVLLVAAGHGLPPAALAFFVLPEAARLDDSVWWNTWKDPRWQTLEYHLPIPDRECPVIPTDGLEALLEQGVKELLHCVSAEPLADFYAQLLVETNPAVLRSEGGELSPLALAALLLPLERSFTERISLAGGFPSLTFNAQRLTHWNGVVCPPGVSGIESAVPERQQTIAREFVRKLEQSISASAGLLKPLEPELSSGGKFLLDFLRSDERWFAPGKMSPESLASVGPLRVARSEEESAFLRKEVAAFVSGVEALPPSDEKRHLITKCDQLKALLVAVSPGSESLRVATLQSTPIVPALFFASRVLPQDWSEFGNYSREEFATLVRQSLRCLKPMAREVEAWLNDCANHPSAGIAQDYAQECLASSATSLDWPSGRR